MPENTLTFRPHTPYRLTADATIGPFKAGDVVYMFTGATYGVIADGVPVSAVDGEYPFYEVARENLEVSS